MACSHFYGMCRWVFDENTQSFRKSVELEVTLASGVEYSDYATADKPQPEVGDPVIWHVIFPQSDDYSTVLAGTCPQLPPAASDLFTFCTRTYGAQAEVCDFYMPVNEQWLIDYNAYLAYWHAPLYAQVQSEGNLLSTMKRTQIINATALLINPAVTPLPES